MTAAEEEKTGHLRDLSKVQTVGLRNAFIYGRGSHFGSILTEIERVATFDVEIFIQGESGTGKTELAKLIHNMSGKNGEFFKINCTDIPETLIESELFGHKKGAFTGADTSRKGIFETAEGGTLLLDEIGDISLNFQAKLLAVIEEKEFSPVGSSKKIQTDVRLIFATNQDIEKKIKEGKFRKDLFYRLNVHPVMIPSLRERREDILEILEHYLAKYRERYKSTAYLSQEARQALEEYDWPGNIREMQNILRSAFTKLEKGRIELGHLNINLAKADNVLPEVSSLPEVSWKAAVKIFKKSFLLACLKEAGGSRTKMAEMLKLSRPYVSNLLSADGTQQLYDSGEQVENFGFSFQFFEGESEKVAEAEKKLAALIDCILDLASTDQLIIPDFLERHLEAVEAFRLLASRLKIKSPFGDYDPTIINDKGRLELSSSVIGRLSGDKNVKDQFISSLISSRNEMRGTIDKLLLLITTQLNPDVDAILEFADQEIEKEKTARQAAEKKLKGLNREILLLKQQIADLAKKTR